jgi:hypothetical protein
VAFTLNLICYASQPSDAVRRYTSRKPRGVSKAATRHAIVDYDVAASHALANATVEGTQAFVGNIASICRLTAQGVSAISRLDLELEQQSFRER